ncbi:MAG: tetratricopeptide repeat protein [Gemmatimonadales bacterium]|nr:tetratricopeptide repeat protein [Candidatus Palauibacter irciniicola]MYC17749.1 tetratricopeptide repeat protein [Gemmatimonadales bacterium]
MTARRPARRRHAAAGLSAVVLAVASVTAPASAAGFPTPQEAAPAAALADRFQAGNRLYQAGDHEGALEAWLGLYEDGFESGELHYNIGNAYFRLGELGRAILFYERARVALPRDESVRTNLALARSLTADQITPLPGFWVPRVAGWSVQLVPRAWLIAIVALGYLGLASILLYRLLSTGPPRWTRHAAVAAAALTFVVGANLLVREFSIGRAERGVILQTEAAVQSAPSDDPSLQLFTIHEGAVVRIDRRSSDWLEIVLEDGKVGWVRAGDLETI